MITNLVDLAIDIRSLAGGGTQYRVAPHQYELRVQAHDIPYGDRVGLNDRGTTEVDLPRPSVPALIFATAVCAIGAVGSAFAVATQGWSAALGVIGFGLPLSYLLWVSLVRTSWVVDDHWLLRRRCLRLGEYAFETEFPVDRLEIENGVWTSGRGSSDALYLIGSKGRTQVLSMDVNNPGRREAVTGEPEVGGNILRLARLFAYKANVPMSVAVKPVSEPSDD